MNEPENDWYQLIPEIKLVQIYENFSVYIWIKKYIQTPQKLQEYGKWNIFEINIEAFEKH